MLPEMRDLTIQGGSSLTDSNFEIEWLAVTLLQFDSDTRTKFVKIETVVYDIPIGTVYSNNPDT